MNEKIWLRISLVLLSITAFALPWQTKLIIRPAVSNYWEISIYAGSILILLSLLALIPSGLINFEKIKTISRYWRIGAAGIIIAGVVSASFSSDPILSFYLLALFVLSLALFIFLEPIPAVWKRRFALFFLLSLAAQAFIGLYQFVTQLSFASTVLGVAYHSAADLGMAVIETADGRWLRAYGASGHPNTFGGLMALGAIGSLIFYAHADLLAKRIPFMFLFIIFIAATLVSFSRAAFLALFIGLIIYICEYRSALREAIKTTLVLVLVSLFFIVSIIWLYHPLYIARTQTANRLEMISINERQEFNQKGFDNFRHHPLFGVGLGASTIADRENSPVAAPAWSFQPAHNYWLLAAAESGIFFVGGLVAIWIFAYQKSRQRRLLSLLAVLFVLTLFDHWLFSLPLASAWTLFLFALM